MTEKELNDLAYQISNKFTAVNTKYLETMGKHLKEIGKLSPTDVHRLEQYMRMSHNVQQMQQEILKASGKTMQELDDIFDQMLSDEYKDNKYLYDFRNKTEQDIRNNIFIQQQIQSMRALTANTLQNIANTTVMSTNYQDLVDKGIYAVANGLNDYNSAIRQELKKASTGARVTYASGITRRLDSAVRMNILDGVRNLWDGIHKQGGEIFGADGYEISAHGLCAPDHIHIQGKQYSSAQFEKLNGSLQRPIGTCNCRHTIFPIILGISQPANDSSILKQYEQYSNEKFTINGKEYTRYQASQLMRQAETAMRYSKDEYILARSAGDEQLMKQAQQKLLKQQSKYREIHDITGLKKEYNRAYVPGYRGLGNNSVPTKVSVGNQTKKKTHKFITGEDISSTWKRDTSKFDSAIKDILHAQKFDKKPLVVGKSKFDDYVNKSNFISQRVYVLDSKEGLDNAVRNLRKGEWRINTSGLNARYGKGMYVFSNYSNSIDDRIEQNIEKYKTLYESQVETPYTQIDTYTLHKSAKIASYMNLVPRYDKFIKESDIYNYNNFDIGSYAAMLGYDAIKVDAGKLNGSITVILNRTKLIIRK